MEVPVSSERIYKVMFVNLYVLTYSTASVQDLYDSKHRKTFV